MKSPIFLFVFLCIFSCEKVRTGDANTSAMINDSLAVNDSLVVAKPLLDTLNNEPKLSDEEILKEQKEREKELSRIVERYTIEKSYNKYRYKIFCEKDKSNMIGFRKIKIFKGGKFLQKIDIPKDSAFIFYDYEFDFSADEDWNFDGFPDMKLMKFHGMVDAQFCLWLYNKKTGKYDFCPSFSKIVNPTIDKKNKEITSSYHTGPVVYYYFWYKFKNGKFVEIKSDVTGEDY